MTAMEEYFPFVTKAYGVMQVTAYAILILIVLWQLFRAFGGPITEAENPWHLVVRGALFGFLIGYAKPIFAACLTIARAPYTSLMDLTMTGEDFTFAGVEQALTNGLTTLVATASVVGLILILIPAHRNCSCRRGRGDRSWHSCDAHCTVRRRSDCCHWRPGRH